MSKPEAEGLARWIIANHEVISDEEGLLLDRNAEGALTYQWGGLPPLGEPEPDVAPDPEELEGVGRTFAPDGEFSMDERERQREIDRERAAAAEDQAGRTARDPRNAPDHSDSSYGKNYAGPPEGTHYIED